jgi:hypothetical protein
VAASLAGNYLRYGNPVYPESVPVAEWSREQIGQRITMIDQLLTANPDPTAAQSLRHARDSLVAKLTNY